jgi:hypothetical protein
VTLTLTCNRHRPFGPVLNQLPVATALHLRVNNTVTCPAIAGRQEARLLAEPARALPAGANLRSASSLQPRFRSPASNARSQSAAARFNIQAPRKICPPQRTGNSTRVSSNDYPLAARRTQPVAVRAAPRNLPYTIRPFSGPPSTDPTNQRGPRRGPSHSIQNGPFRGHLLQQCQ